MKLLCLAILTWIFDHHGTFAVIQVELACPGFVDPEVSVSALAITGPGFEMAVEDVNSRYMGIFNFTLTYLFEGVVEDLTSLDDFGTSMVVE